MDDAFELGTWLVFILICSALGFSCGKDLSRDFIVKEAQRCLEAPDIDTARVCWDAATLGWMP